MTAAVRVLYPESRKRAQVQNLPATESISDRRQSSALEQIVLPHLDAAHNLARWLLGDAILAQDVVQDAVLRAITYLDSFRGGDAKTWFLKIVRNASYSALAARRNAGEVSIHDSPEDDEPPATELTDPALDPEAALGQRQQLMQLDEALAALPVQLRECLVLRELEELSYKDIVRTTGVPMGTVMSRLWRARQLLLRNYAARNRS